MNEQYYYINTDPYGEFPPYDQKYIKKISFTDINTLAYIASNLEAYPAITEIDGKKEALKGYFLKNKDDRLMEIYNVLTLNINGHRILNVAIQLACFEKDFRKNGIKELEKVQKYNQWVEEMNKVIEFNKSFFSEEYIINKNK